MGGGGHVHAVNNCEVQALSEHCSGAGMFPLDKTKQTIHRDQDATECEGCAQPFSPPELGQTSPKALGEG